MSYFNRKKRLKGESLARAQSFARQGEPLDYHAERVRQRRVSHKAEMAAAEARLALGRIL